MSYIIRKAQKEDLPKLVEILNQAIKTKRCNAFDNIFAVEDRIKWFEEHQSNAYPLMVCCDEKNPEIVLGYVTLSPYRKDRNALKGVAEISYYVDLNALKQGIGSHMLGYMIDYANSFGYDHLIAILMGWNDGSKRLLDRYHFELWGDMKDICNMDGDICSHLYYGLKLK